MNTLNRSVALLAATLALSLTPRPASGQAFYFHYDGQPVDARDWTHGPPFSPVIVTDLTPGGGAARHGWRPKGCAEAPEEG
jgi:hypothetical protein